jgi:hypothetical protein
MKTTTYIFLFLIVIGCSQKSKQKGLVYYNDYESIKGWSSPLVLTKETAHSGTYSNKLDTGLATFGNTFRLKFKEIIPARIKKVKLSFWAYLTDVTSEGKFVIDITGSPENKSVFWIAKDINDALAGHGKWTEVKVDYTLEDKVTLPGNTILIYPWNTGKKAFYIDDVRIEFVI